MQRSSADWIFPALISLRYYSAYKTNPWGIPAVALRLISALLAASLPLASTAFGAFWSMMLGMGVEGTSSFASQVFGFLWIAAGIGGIGLSLLAGFSVGTGNWKRGGDQPSARS